MLCSALSFVHSQGHTQFSCSSALLTRSQSSFHSCQCSAHFVCVPSRHLILAGHQAGEAGMKGSKDSCPHEVQGYSLACVSEPSFTFSRSLLFVCQGHLPAFETSEITFPQVCPHSCHPIATLLPYMILHAWTL